MNPPRITVGRVTAPQGIRGEVRVWPQTDFPERFLERKRFYLEGAEPRWVDVERARLHQGVVLLKFADYDDRNAAETLRGYELQVLREDLPTLPPGQYYHNQLVGLEVITAEGLMLGYLEEILSPGANDVFVVRSETGGKVREYLIPAIREVVAEIDLEGGRMVVVPIPGLLD